MTTMDRGIIFIFQMNVMPLLQLVHFSRQSFHQRGKHSCQVLEIHFELCVAVFFRNAEVFSDIAMRLNSSALATALTFFNSSLNFLFAC